MKMPMLAILILTALLTVGCEVSNKEDVKKDSAAEEESPPRPLLGKCLTMCPRILLPVCASNGKTYPNECAMKGEMKCKKIMLKVVHKGECKKVIKPIPVPGKCLTACPRILLPVCASNGKTYPNECVMKGEMKCKNIMLKVVHYGKCENRCLTPCPYILAPVCASNGKTYPNECVMKAEMKCKRILLKVVHQGKCKEVEPQPVLGKCFTPCPLLLAPVCASNGKTYANECVMKGEMKCKRILLKVVHKGACLEIQPYHLSINPKLLLRFIKDEEEGEGGTK